jgi:hypothetical protein
LKKIHAPILKKGTEKERREVLNGLKRGEGNGRSHTVPR